MPVSLVLAMPVAEGWEDASDYESAEKPYCFRRAGLAGSGALRVWCCENRRYRAPCGSEREAMEFLRQVIACGSFSRELSVTARQYPFGPGAMVAYVTAQSQFRVAWLLARADAFIFARYDGATRDQVDRDLSDCIEMMGNARVDEE